MGGGQVPSSMQWLQMHLVCWNYNAGMRKVCKFDMAAAHVGIITPLWITGKVLVVQEASQPVGMPEGPRRVLVKQLRRACNPIK